MTGPKIMLVAPAFHGYSQSIARGFEVAGHDVVLHEYDHLDGFRAKLRHKALVELPAKLGLTATGDVRVGAQTAQAIRDERPDVVIVVRGDHLDEVVHEAIDAVGARRILWLWDEVRRTGHTDASLDRFPQLISYSPLDTQAFRAAGRECIHVPNAFDHTMVPARRPQSNEILFIGARYPRREQLVADLVCAGVPVMTVGRSWSRHPFDRARTWEWRRPEVQSMRDVPRMQGYEMTAGAPAALNIHFDQDGFTMKTFEAPGVGGVQLIDRPDVAEYYEPGTEVLVYESPEELVDLACRSITDDRWGDKIREAGQRRTLAEHTFVHSAREVAKLWA